MDGPTMFADGELVIDGSNSLIDIYPYRNSADTKLMLDSTDALVLVCGAPGVSSSVLDGAGETDAEKVRELIELLAYAGCVWWSSSPCYNYMIDQPSD